VSANDASTPMPTTAALATTLLVDMRCPPVSTILYGASWHRRPPRVAVRAPRLRRDHKPLREVPRDHHVCRLGPNGKLLLLPEPRRARSARTATGNGALGVNDNGRGSVGPTPRLAVIPTIKVERPRQDGPFRVGATYGVAESESARARRDALGRCSAARPPGRRSARHGAVRPPIGERCAQPTPRGVGNASSGSKSGSHARSAQATGLYLLKR
jgi:hypothetical protein